MDAGHEVTYGSYRIRPKSERVHASAKTAGWKPVAEVSREAEGSLIAQRIEPARITLVPTKEEADRIAVQAARSWVEKRALFGEHLNEAARILKEWVKGG
jgi:hypothetical protein